MLVTMGVFGVHLRAQEDTGSSGPKAGYVDDWTHHHLIFSNPGSRDDAARNGTLDKWLKVTNDPRYQLQQIKRNLGPRPVIGGGGSAWGWENSGNGNRNRGGGGKPGTTISGVTKDWSVVLGGGSALISTVAPLNSGNINSNSTVTFDFFYTGGDIASQVLTASPPTTASRTGTFTGNPTAGQTVTIGGTEVLTASATTAATASITIGSNFCFAPGTGVNVNGTSFTTNGTEGTGTYVVNHTPGNGEQVVIGGVTYTFETTLSGTTPANQVLIDNGQHGYTAQNLSVAINDSGTCGYTSGGVCTRNVTAANPEVSSTNTTNDATQTMTGRCAGTITNTGSTNVTVNNVVGGAGSNSATNRTFAVGTNAATATNIFNDINGNATTSAIITATNPSGGVVDLTANTTGTGGNSYTLSDTATSGVTLVGFSGGAVGSNAGTNFLIDGVVGDDATQLAAAITRNGSTVAVSGHTIGVTAGATGAVVTVTASTPGTTANSMTLAETLSNFTWAGGDLAGGTDGTTAGGLFANGTFAYWSGYTYVSAAQLATNIATALNDSFPTDVVTTATANSPASGEITFTELAFLSELPGEPVYESVSESQLPALTGLGTIPNGVQAAVQPNAFPAKFGAVDTASCTSDFVVYPTGQAGEAGATATIIAYNNLYGAGGCATGSVPSVYWAYDTASNGESVTTSPIISNDSTGSQVAFMQSNGTAASLVILKWAPGSISSVNSPATITTETAATYRACGAPCMVSIPFSSSGDDSISAPYYDYVGDAIYVGDDSGKLHKFTGVFNGTPAEAGSPWPVTLGSAKVSSPVYDGNSGNVFVGDLAGTLYSVTSAGVKHGSAAIGDAIADAPLVDGNAQTVYAFVTTSGGNNVVDRFSTAFTSLTVPSSPAVAVIGTGGTGYYLYAGMFDNVYFQSTTYAGNLYAVGNTGATTGATLYRIPVTGGSLGTPVNALGGSSVLTASGANPYPSPLTEFCNGTCTTNGTITNGGGTDYIFFSVNQGTVGTGTPCSGTAGNGCILSYNVTNPSSVTLSGFQDYSTLVTSGCWATGGVVIDNDAATTGASQIYFVNMNGASAGGPNGLTSSTCSTSPPITLEAIQAEQNNP